MIEQDKNIPVIALRGVTVLPSMAMHLDISRKRSLEAANHAMTAGKSIFLVAQLDKDNMNPTMEDLCSVGTIAKIKQIIRMPNGFVRVLVEGLERAILKDIRALDPFMEAVVEDISIDNEYDTVHAVAMARIIKDKLTEYFLQNPKASKELQRLVSDELPVPLLLDSVAGNFPMAQSQRQQYLEIFDLNERFKFLVQLISDEIIIQEIKRDFQAQVKQRIDKNQKDYILREQLKIIHEELGETNPVSDADRYTEELKKRKIEKSIKEKIDKEIQRFRTLPSGSQEASVLQAYIETLLEMPWNKSTKEAYDLNKAELVLNTDHYGLDKVKERILEYLAVHKMNGGKDNPILCLVGPPGTGKTSIAKSVANALNKKYVRISLGGVRDEAEIRGHRRTYVGAMPGRIATGLKQAGVKNPLMLLDEIDKIGSDYKGDPSAALLEVLDIEQNNKFRDHYLEVPLDLSNVLFIATANTIQTIPGPLRDRLEIIEVSSYTENEKYHIAKQYLLKKQVVKHGLKPEQLAVSDGALRKVIRNYTREAGVRGLERKIGQLCRKAVWEILQKQSQQVEVNEENLDYYLGKERIKFDNVNEQDEVGIVRGLAWTSVGGDTLQIEVNCMPGKGRVQLTGKLGDVMKESAQTALSYIRSIADTYNVEKDFFENHDIHIHIPEGAVPKDGPSAGITMATAMLSAITGIKVRANVAMTGEVTLRGRVLPIGGLKEKILAAKLAGIQTILIPKKNQPDVEELSNEITDGLKIYFVERMEEVIKEAFLK